MKTCNKKSFIVPVLAAALGSLAAGQLTAQTFTTLHSFTEETSAALTNIDGAIPGGALVLSGNTLYGTTAGGGSSGNGTVFKINTDGSGFTVLYNFTATYGPPPLVNSDGVQPNGNLVVSGNTLYGTACAGGSVGSGTVFALNTDGTGFRTLYDFSEANDPWCPGAGLILSGNTLYGVTLFSGFTFFGGGGTGGTVFAINTDGTGYRNLYWFSGLDGLDNRNSDGADPAAVLMLSGNTLYGTTSQGGPFAGGTVFSLNTDGTGFTNLHSFTGWAGNGAPISSLTICSNTLYGTRQSGGDYGYGMVFALNTDGSGFTNLYSFNVTGPIIGDLQLYYIYYSYAAGLVLSGNTLYGTTSQGGDWGDGMAFAVNTDGTGFTALHSFTPVFHPDYTNSDGHNPDDLILSGNTLYGTANGGGSGSDGTIFSISLPGGPPQLTITAAGANAILTWPTNASGFNLQSTTDLGPSAIWSTNLPAPVVVNGMNTVTTPISGTQQFFRLSQ